MSIEILLLIVCGILTIASISLGLWLFEVIKELQDKINVLERENLKLSRSILTNSKSLTEVTNTITTSVKSLTTSLGTLVDDYSFFKKDIYAFVDILKNELLNKAPTSTIKSDGSGSKLN